MLAVHQSLIIVPGPGAEVSRSLGVFGAFSASHKLNRLGSEPSPSLLSPQSLVPT